MRDVPCRSCQLTSPPSLWMRSGWVHPHCTHQPPNLSMPVWPLASFLARATAASPFIHLCLPPTLLPSSRSFHFSHRKASASVISWLLLRKKPAQNLVV